MNYEFRKLSEVEALDEVPEGATVLAEVGGQIKRVPGSGLGGDTGIKTAIIKDSRYDQALAGVQSYMQANPEPEVTYSCINMTFEEAYETLASGEPMQVHLMLTFNNLPSNIDGIISFAGTLINNVPSIIIEPRGASDLFWTADGISTEEPGDK